MDMRLPPDVERAVLAAAVGTVRTSALPTSMPISEKTFMASMPISEKAFMARVVECAKSHGWRVYHTHNSRRSAKGFPDLVLVRRGVCVFAELKRSRAESPTAEQAAWLADLAACGLPAHLWTPEAWNEIEATLKGE